MTCATDGCFGGVVFVVLNHAPQYIFVVVSAGAIVAWESSEISLEGNTTFTRNHATVGGEKERELGVDRHEYDYHIH